MSLVYSRTVTLAASSVNNIALSQTPLAAGPLTLNGSTVVNGIAVLDTQRIVQFTFAANETGHNFVITGTNSDGTVISETVAGTAPGTASSQFNYQTVTSITISAAATGAIQVGTSSVGASPFLMIDTFRQPINVGIEVIVTGTVNYTVQYTVDAFWAGPPVVIPNAFNHATLVNATTTQYGSITTPVTGIRLQVNSGSGSATMTYSYAGP